MFLEGGPIILHDLLIFFINLLENLPLNTSTGPAVLQLLLLACGNIPASVATDLYWLIE